MLSEAAAAEDELAAGDVLRLETNANGYPDKAITLLVGGNPGGGWDQLARLIQHVVVTEDIAPVPVEVINRGGAGGTIGLAELVTKHSGNPHTLMIIGSTLVSATISHQSEFTIFDTAPVARIISEYEVIAVPPDSPYENFAQLIEQLRRDPASITWGGGSAAGVDHILVGLIARAAGVDPREINYVAFTGGGEASAAVMGGQITAGVAGLAEWKELAAAERMRLIAISSPERLAGIEIPTIREQGFDVVLENWRGIALPEGIDSADRAWVLEAITRMRSTQSWRDLLEKYNWEDSFLTGQPFDRFLNDDVASTANVLSSLGLGGSQRDYAVIGPYAFPALSIAGLIIFGGLMVWEAWRKTRQSGGPVRSNTPATEDVMDSVSWSRFAAGASASLVYILSLPLVGFLAATPFFVVVQSRIIGSRRLLRDAIVAVALTAGAAAVFTYALNVELP